MHLWRERHSTACPTCRAEGAPTWLFSMMKITGTFHRAAMLYACSKHRLLSARTNAACWLPSHQDSQYVTAQKGSHLVHLALIGSAITIADHGHVAVLLHLVVQPQAHSQGHLLPTLQGQGQATCTCCARVCGRSWDVLCPIAGKLCIQVLSVMWRRAMQRCCCSRQCLSCWAPSVRKAGCTAARMSTHVCTHDACSAKEPVLHCTHTQGWQSSRWMTR